MKRWLCFLLATILVFSLSFPALAIVPPLPQGLIPILDVQGLGKVEVDIDAKKLVFTCYNPGVTPMEYSILAGSNYSQSEAGGWGAPETQLAVKKESLPHYLSFMVAIGRYEKFQVGFGRENDGELAFYALPYFPPSPSPTPTPTPTSTPSGPTINLLYPEGERYYWRVKPTL